MCGSLVVPVRALLGVLGVIFLVACDEPRASRVDPGEVSGSRSRAAPLMIGAAEQSAGRYALLVAVSRYTDNPSIRNLEGPPNDLHLMKDMLTGPRFGFAEADIAVLQAKDADRHPTRDNILRELDALAKRAKAGDQVVVYLSGHGSRVPRQADRRDRNPHALTGLFLPQDTGTWEGNKVHNSIADWELAERTAAIVATGARLWLVIDSCHSGGLVREKVRGGTEVSRDVPAKDLGVPQEQMRKALEEQSQVKRTEVSRGPAPLAGRSLGAVIDSPNIAVTYACRAFEETPERRFPVESAEPAEGPYGLFTYTLCQALNGTGAALTYDELVRRINGQYDAWGRNASPYCVAEGGGRHEFVLGAGERRTPIRLVMRDGRWSITAGRLHGVNPGSVLAVYPPPGDPNADRLLGHVRVASAQTFFAAVEPAAFAQVAAPAVRHLKPDSACRLVYLDFGIEPLRVYVGEDPANREFLEAKAKLTDAELNALRREAEQLRAALRQNKPDQAPFFTI